MLIVSPAAEYFFKIVIDFLKQIFVYYFCNFFPFYFSYYKQNLKEMYIIIITNLRSFNWYNFVRIYIRSCNILYKLLPLIKSY